jgi:hypothetical protein
MNGDRQRAIAYHDLERFDDDQALLLHGDLPADRSHSRDAARAPRPTGATVKRGWTPDLHHAPWLTERERQERWPLG